jgi:nicotinamide-nucleotide amidase
MSARAGIVVTGTEVLSGRVRDRNGPWLADRLAELGVELAHVTICGDRPDDMVAQLDFMRAQGVDLIVTSGGLGPTADDLTIEVVARWSGRELRLDEALEERIAAILARLSARWRTIDPAALREANRKQAMVPEGAEVIEPAGTAPGVVVPGSDGASPVPAVVVLPGPPRELHAMWRAAVETEPFRAAVAGATRYSQRMLRLFGIPESELAATLREARERVEGFDDLEITTCLRRGEVEAVIRFEPDREAASDALAELIAARHERSLFSTDGSSIDDQVAALLADGGHHVGVGESCTGGLMAARLTERAGASSYVAGGVVAYSNEAKSTLLGVDTALLERFGAVSPEVARAMADGALARFAADVGVAITGVAGPGGGTQEKPVGYVCWCVVGPDGRAIARDVQIPGDRAEIRDRSTTVGMHLVRRLLRGEEAPI